MLLSLSPLSAPPAAQASTPAWTHDGYGPGNTGYNPAESVVNASRIKKLRLKWRATPRPDIGDCQEQTTPVVASGRMFMIDGGGVGAYSFKTGRRLWNNTTFLQDLVHRTMTVAGGLVISTGYNCFGVSNPSGHIIAFDAKTGNVRWTVLEGSATESVVADRGMLISYSVCEICSSYLVSGYRASDGASMWEQEGALGNPVSATGRLLLTGVDAGSFAVAATTGRVLWRSDTAWSVLASNPAGNQFYVSGPDDQLAALNAATGEVIWSTPMAAGKLAADGRRVYVSREDNVTAYDAEDGRPLWRRAGVPNSRPIRAGGLLYMAGIILSPTNGSLVLSATYSSQLHHAVVIGGRVLRVKDYEVQAYGP
ncbi:PQQ-binding-like beta-propeller repeat protein [Krasilnikovia sp. MM14-A1259]|uniref:outer membrane protein assembly factor BamB family protein n=1 Tax=Krasilnikovia sp. MM14-A1259 TaxID=3373539 RepID=UPI00399CC6C8